MLTSHTDKLYCWNLVSIATQLRYRFSVALRAVHWAKSNRSYCSLLFKFLTFCIFEPSFGGLRLLGTTYDVHLGLIWCTLMSLLWCTTFLVSCWTLDYIFLFFLYLGSICSMYVLCVSNPAVAAKWKINHYQQGLSTREAKSAAGASPLYIYRYLWHMGRHFRLTENGQTLSADKMTSMWQCDDVTILADVART